MTGDLVDIVAPGASAPPEALQKGLEVLKTWGLNFRLPEDTLKASTFFSNTDAARLKFLDRALRAKDSKAVWFIRGGSGTHRILPGLFRKQKPLNSKWVLGFSDATSLLAGLGQRWKWPTLHAPVLTQLGRGELADADAEELRALLFGEQTDLRFSNLRPLNHKAEKLKTKIKGVVHGGNLAVFQTLIGTKDMPKTSGSILFFEDVGERGYRLDRSFTHLKQAGAFDGVKAVVLGDFTAGDEPGSVKEKPINRTSWALQNFADGLNEISVPVFTGMNVGHGNRNRPLPLGIAAELNAGSKTGFELSMKLKGPNSRK